MRTYPIILELTRDELTILQYLMPSGTWGDPLKDTYELGADEPAEPYAVLASLYQKVSGVEWPGDDRRAMDIRITMRKLVEER